MTGTEPLYVQRIREELRLLAEKAGIEATYVSEGGSFVLYKSVATGGPRKGLPAYTDVLVPVPPGYPASAIDMPALPVGSPLIPHVYGGSNPQNSLQVLGQQWRVLSYHPYSNGGGPSWNPSLHGFFDYYQHLFTWLHQLI